MTSFTFWIPCDESAWLSFTKLAANFKEAVVIQKFRLLQQSLGGLEWGCTQEFLTYYKKLSRSVQQLLNKGANARELNVDAIAVDLNLGRAWHVYRSITRAVSPTSIAGERTLSCLSRLRTKFRRNLRLHLPECVRASQSKTVRAGHIDDAFIDEHVGFREGSPDDATGYPAGSRAKKARVEEEPHLLADDEPRLLTEDEQDIPKVQCEARLRTRAKLVKYFADDHENSDLDFESNSDNLDSDEGFGKL